MCIRIVFIFHSVVFLPRQSHSKSSLQMGFGECHQPECFSYSLTCLVEDQNICSLSLKACSASTRFGLIPPVPPRSQEAMRHLSFSTSLMCNRTKKPGQAGESLQPQMFFISEFTGLLKASGCIAWPPVLRNTKFSCVMTGL